MKIVKKIDVDPQEIKDKIILLEKQLRQYIRILGLVIATVILETVLVLFSIVNFDFLYVWFLVFLLFISWITWKKINSIVISLAIHSL